MYVIFLATSQIFFSKIQMICTINTLYNSKSSRLEISADIYSLFFIRRSQIVLKKEKIINKFRFKEKLIKILEQPYILLTQYETLAKHVDSISTSG